MDTVGDGTLDEAYERLHRTGPEFEGWLTNHGPMTVESMVRRGQGRVVHRWLDGYVGRLEDLPGRTSPIGPGDWRPALGDADRLGDWLAFFDREVRERPWREVLVTWWPRLLPGIAAGATHGVIRTGHAAHTLLSRDETYGPRVAELGQALGYWAARWQPVPAAGALSGPPDGGGAAEAFAAVPRVPTRAGASGTAWASWPTCPDGHPHSARRARPARPRPRVCGSPSWPTPRRSATSRTGTARGS